MDFWLIRNGEKSGPYRDYEIRAKISDGDLGAEDYAWHEGMEGWSKLVEIELFREEFRKQQERPMPPPLPEHGSVPASGEPRKLHLIRRFWARWLDLFLFGALWWLGMYVAGRDIAAALLNPWLQLTIYVPWFMLEAWMIRRFGATPGKWLLGLRVINEDGTQLDSKAAAWRSLRVLVTGVGFGWGLLALCCQGLSWVTTRLVGKPVWDHIGKHKVVASPHRPMRIVLVVLLFLATAQLKFAVVGPHQEKMIIEEYPQWKELLEGQDKWYFPVKE